MHLALDPVEGSCLSNSAVSRSSQVLSVSCSVRLRPLTKSFYSGHPVSPATGLCQLPSALEILLPSCILIFTYSVLSKNKRFFLGYKRLGDVL